MKKRHVLPVVALGLSVLLLGCESAEDKKFVQACIAKRGFTETQCSCVNGLIKDGLNDKGQAYVRAIVLGNQSDIARIQSTFGILEGTNILARSAWLATNSQQACQVQI